NGITAIQVAAAAAAPDGGRLVGGVVAADDRGRGRTGIASVAGVVLFERRSPSRRLSMISSSQYQRVTISRRLSSSPSGGATVRSASRAAAPSADSPRGPAAAANAKWIQGKAAMVTRGAGLSASAESPRANAPVDGGEWNPPAGRACGS